MGAPPDIERNIDRILESQDKGIREFEQTLANLTSLLQPLDEPARSRFLDYLFQQLTQRIRRRYATDPTGIDRQRKSIGVLFRIQFEFGRADMVLCKILGFIDVDSADVSNNWMNFVSQEITSAVYRLSEDLSQGTIEALKEHVALYSHPGSDLARAMPAFSPFVLGLRRAIENAEFSRFERQLRADSSDVPVAAQGDDRPAATVADSAVVGAMKEAAQYLCSDGQFNPKKAADLMKTSIDESHRELVTRLAVATGRPCADAN